MQKSDNMTRLFEDESKISELEKFNRERALTNILESEEHMSLEGSGDDNCPHPWCARKHILLARGHMREAVEHADFDHKDMYREAHKKLDDWLDGGDIDELRRLRNWLRGKFKDTSLGVKCDDGVCHYDVEGLEIDVSSDDDKEDITDDEEEKDKSDVESVIDDIFTKAKTEKFERIS